MATTPTHLQVYQGKQLIDENKFGPDMQFGQVPPGNKPYRVVLDDEPPGDIFRLSTRTHTRVDGSCPTPCRGRLRAVPVMNLDYRLDTDLRGDVKAGRST